jgi:hypothetical protein
MPGRKRREPPLEGGSLVIGLSQKLGVPAFCVKPGPLNLRPAGSLGQRHGVSNVSFQRVDT